MIGTAKGGFYGNGFSSDDFGTTEYANGNDLRRIFVVVRWYSC
jgi:hypothetical protein